MSGSDRVVQDAKEVQELPLNVQVSKHHPLVQGGARTLGNRDNPQVCCPHGAPT